MTTRKNLKKRASTVTAVLLAAALLLGGTFAWNDTRQHKTNPFAASNAKGAEGMETRDVSLNNQFTPPSGWEWPALETNTLETPNTISVSNMSSSTTHTFVRVSVKQYMELRSTGKDANGDENFYRDNLGNIILVATWASGPNIGRYMTVDEAKERGMNYGVLQVRIGTDDNDLPIFQEYATTAVAETRNGIYGKGLVQSALEAVWGNVPKAPLNHGPQTPGTGECKYTPAIKGAPSLEGTATDTGLGIDRTKTIGDLDSYVKIGWTEKVTDKDGTEIDNIMSFKEWVDPEGNNGEWVDKWIYDDTTMTGDEIKAGKAQEGWVYWGTPLQKGQSTTDLISHIATTGKNPMTSLLQAEVEGKIDYTLHTDMEAVSGFASFTGADLDIPEVSEVDKLFKPTLPAGADKVDTVAGRDEFFAAMNKYELESFEDRKTLRLNKKVARYDLMGWEVDPADPTAATFALSNAVENNGNIFTHTFEAPPAVLPVVVTEPDPANPTTHDLVTTTTATFKGWATSKTNAEQKVLANVGAARFTPGTGFAPLSVNLGTNDVTRYFAVWETNTTSESVSKT